MKFILIVLVLLSGCATVPQIFVYGTGNYINYNVDRDINTKNPEQ